jgi:hypothetical protein
MRRENAGLEAYGSGQVLVIGSCEHRNTPSDSMKGRKYLDQLSEYYFLNKVLVSWSYIFSQ